MLHEEKWVKRMIQLAMLVSTWSKDPDAQVGAVIFDSNYRVQAVGYNGYPRGAVDEYANVPRRRKLWRTVHAELNAILHAGHAAKGCTLLTYPYPPCHSCVTTAIQAGIRAIIAPEVPIKSKWFQECSIARIFARQNGLCYTMYTTKHLFEKENKS